jgi:hypothetical protein
VLEIKLGVNAVIQEVNGTKEEIVHVSRLKKFVEPRPPLTPLDSDDVVIEEEEKQVADSMVVDGNAAPNVSKTANPQTLHEVELIKKHRNVRGQDQYLVKWKHLLKPTWEAASNLVNCDEAIEEFKISQSLECGKCNFIAKTKKGLKTHVEKEHKTIQ